MVMQHVRREGIILRAASTTKSRTVLLDRHAGKMHCFVYHTSSLSAGELVSYVATSKSSGAVLEQVELLDAPLAVARDDLLFLHHVLELCDMFTPINSPAPELFHLLLHLYNWDAKQIKMAGKLLFLTRLILLLGIHHRDPSLKPQHLERLLTHSIDITLLYQLNLSCQRELRGWLVESIISHTPSEQFTTLSFLRNIG